MKINLNFNSFKFGQVYAVAGSQEKMEDFLSKLSPSKNIIAMHATDIYTKMILTDCVQKQQKKVRIYFLL